MANSINVSGIANLIKGVYSPSELLLGSGPHKIGTANPNDATKKKSDFAQAIKAVEKYINKIDNFQQLSDRSIKELLAGKNEDIMSVVAAVAKADMSFKLLVGVRNKLIEAYKQTMNMPL